MIEIFGIQLKPEDVKDLHERFVKGDALMGLVERMREQTKELLAQPDADGPTLYREQGAAIAFKKLLSIPQLVKRLVHTLEMEKAGDDI